MVIVSNEELNQLKEVYLSNLIWEEQLIIINESTLTSEKIVSLLTKVTYECQVNNLPICFTFNKSYTQKGMLIMIYFVNVVKAEEFLSLLDVNNHILNLDLLIKLNTELTDYLKLKKD